MANLAGDAQLFEDTFTITDYDQSKYDRVARISATSADNQTALKLDINIELFPCLVGETLQVVLATSLSHDGLRDDESNGAADAATRGWRDVRDEGSSLADAYDYVCHGKIYKLEDGADGQTMCVLLPSCSRWIVAYADSDVPQPRIRLVWWSPHDA
jgi:DNA-directed RNA polymerases I, II, and III subunit RPABC3